MSPTRSKPPALNFAAAERSINKDGHSAAVVLGDDQDEDGRPVTPPILTLDSDDDDRGNETDESDIGPDADEISKDLKALNELRKSVQNNLRLRPIRSSQRLPKVDIFASHSPDSNSLPTSSASSRMPWYPPDSSETSNTDTDTDASSRTTATTIDSDADLDIDLEPVSAVSAYFTPLTATHPSPFPRTPHFPDSLAPPISSLPVKPITLPEPASSVSPASLPSLLSASRVPLLIDTRPPPAHLAAHITGSISLAIPSLILKRTRRTKPKTIQPTAANALSSTGLPTLHALRQFISTDDSLVAWDALIPPVPESSDPKSRPPNTKWNGSIIVYDDDMDPKLRDTPTAAAWALLHILPPLLAQVLEDRSLAHDLPAETRGKVEYLEGGFSAVQGLSAMKPHLNHMGSSTSRADTRDTQSSGTQATVASKGPAVKMGPPPRRSTTGMLGKKPSGLFQLDTQTALRSKQLPEIEFSTASSSSLASSPTSINQELEPDQSRSQASSQKPVGGADMPRSPLPVMSAIMSSASPISPFVPTTGNFTSSPSSAISTPSSLGSGVKLNIPVNLIVDSSPSPPPSQSHPQLAFRRPLPPNVRRPSVPNLRRLEISASASFTDAGVMSAHESSSSSGGPDRRIPRLDIMSATATRAPRLNAKSAERLPKLSLRTTGIGSGPGARRSATLSVPPSAINGPYGQNTTHEQIINHYPLPGASKNAALRSPVDWALLHSGFGKMSEQAKGETDAGKTASDDAREDSGGHGQVVERTEVSSTGHHTPYFTPPHSPGTPRAQGFTLINGASLRRDKIGSDLPPSPQTARPEESPSSWFPPSPPNVGVDHSLSDSVLVCPPTSSAAAFPRSSFASTFDAPSPPRTAFGDVFHDSHGGFEHGDGMDDPDSQLTTEDPNPPFTVSTILPSFLFLGPEPTTEDHLQMLKVAGVKRILNIAAECGKDDHGLALGENFEKYIKIPMRDHVEEEGVGEKVREVCEILDDARLHSSPTYVHCKAGKSRSVTAIIAYLIHANHWTLSQAYAFVVERRKGVSPNIGFVTELMTFEEEELGGKSIGVQPSAPPGHTGAPGADAAMAASYAPIYNRKGGHVRESLPPVFSGPASALELEGDNSGSNIPISAGSMAVGLVRAELGQDKEIKDAQGRWRHARRAPVDEQTLQPLRRVSKAGLESSVYG